MRKLNSEAVVKLYNSLLYYPQIKEILEKRVGVISHTISGIAVYICNDIFFANQYPERPDIIYGCTKDILPLKTVKALINLIINEQGEYEKKISTVVQIGILDDILNIDEEEFDRYEYYTKIMQSCTTMAGLEEAYNLAIHKDTNIKDQGLLKSLFSYKNHKKEELKLNF